MLRLQDRGWLATPIKLCDLKVDLDISTIQGQVNQAITLLTGSLFFLTGIPT